LGEGRCFRRERDRRLRGPRRLFTLYPILRLFLRALSGSRGPLSLTAFTERIATSKVWGNRSVVTNTLQLGLMTALAATLLALCFALIVTRTRLPGRRLAGVLAVLPMITPPFVIGPRTHHAVRPLGRGQRDSRVGVRGQSDPLDLRLPGVWLAQDTGADAGAYLVLVGVVEGISPSSRKPRKRCARRAHAALFNTGDAARCYAPGICQRVS
jgi:iron(III) transport system permease protein